MKKPSPYPSISWDMDLKSTPALNSTRDHHVRVAAVPAAAAVDDDLKVGGKKRQHPKVLPFLMEEVFKNIAAFGADAGNEQRVETQTLQMKGVVQQPAAGSD